MLKERHNILSFREAISPVHIYPVEKKFMVSRKNECGDIACVLYQRDIREADDFDGMNVKKVKIAHNNAAAESVLDIQILDDEDGLQYVFDYEVGRYKQETMSEFQNLFKRVVAAIVNNTSTDGYDFGQLKKDLYIKESLMQKIKAIFAKK